MQKYGKAVSVNPTWVDPDGVSVPFPATLSLFVQDHARHDHRTAWVDLLIAGLPGPLLALSIYDASCG